MVDATLYSVFSGHFQGQTAPFCPATAHDPQFPAAATTQRALWNEVIGRDEVGWGEVRWVRTLVDRACCYSWSYARSVEGPDHNSRR